ncbi:MAG: dTMP kinase [Zwartia sp.]
MHGIGGQWRAYCDRRVRRRFRRDGREEAYNRQRISAHAELLVHPFLRRAFGAAARRATIRAGAAALAPTRTAAALLELRELGAERIAVLEQWVHPDLQPDCTWLFDVPLAVARERLDRTRKQDRFEQEADAFFERTRAVYLARAQLQPARIQRIDATQTIAQIRQHLSQQLDQLVTMRGLG